MSTGATPKVLTGAVLLVAVGLALGWQGRSDERPTGPVEAARCTTCHADVKDHDAVHGPVFINACSACHRLESAREHTYSLIRQGADLCTYCHDMDFDGAAVIHAPLAEGDCTGCHDPHGGTDTRFLKAPSVDELCKTCHDDVINANRYVHGPVAVGACSVCHAPHASPYPGLLTAPESEVCVGCHVTTRTQLETMRYVHEPARTDCGSCHDAHASNHAMMLHQEPQALCVGCHDGIRHTVETAATQHAAVTTDRQCLNCHDPHASDHPRVLVKDMKSLCYECHDREIRLDSGVTLGDIKAVIESGASLHGPVAQNNCAACHLIHGGDNFRMLVQEYPAEFYAPFKEERYALCFSCHDKQLVFDRHTTALTDFRNGDLNLHFLHVNRDKKGRTCRACHETHASSKEKHIRDSVPFGPGGWELPIGFEKTSTGGRCSPGCHAAYGYDRVNPVEYPEPDRPAIWPKSGASP